MKVRFKKLDEKAVTPTRAHATDAGLDLTATSKYPDINGCIVFGTGIAVEIPTGHVGLLFPRSSVSRTGLVLTNCVGVIDSGYRGEVLMKFRICGYGDRYEYNIGDRIGQLVIIPIPQVELIESDELSDSERGTGGYGSSGK